jgi:hypothetical protein
MWIPIENFVKIGYKGSNDSSRHFAGIPTYGIRPK